MSAARSPLLPKIRSRSTLFEGTGERAQARRTRAIVASPERPSVACGQSAKRSQTTMSDDVLPPATKELVALRKQLAPDIHDAFSAFSKRVFADGALPAKVKQLIAVAAAHVTQCPYCIRGHTQAALRHGATAEEVMEAIWVAAEMRAGGAYAHAVVAVDAIAAARDGRSD